MYVNDVILKAFKYATRDRRRVINMQKGFHCRCETSNIDSFQGDHVPGIMYKRIPFEIKECIHIWQPFQYDTWLNSRWLAVEAKRNFACKDPTFLVKDLCGNSDLGSRAHK